MLETQKLDLMAEVSDLKIKMAGMEKEQIEYEEKQNKAEVSFASFPFEIIIPRAELSFLSVACHIFSIANDRTFFQ